MPTVDDVIKKYIAIRDERSLLKQKYEQEDAVLKDKLEKIESWLLAKQRELGVTQLKSEERRGFPNRKNKI